MKPFPPIPCSILHFEFTQLNKTHPIKFTITFSFTIKSFKTKYSPTKNQIITI